MNKNKKKMSKKPKRKTKKPRYYKDKSVKQNVNVKNIISAGGGAGGGGSSSYPVPMPQYIQTPIPQAFQQTNTENMNMRSLIDEVKNAIRRPVYNPPPVYNSPPVADLLDLDTVHSGYRDVKDQFDPVIKDITPQQVLNYNINDDEISQLSEPPIMAIPFGGSNMTTGNLSEFIYDMENYPQSIDSSRDEVPIVPEPQIVQPFTKNEDPNKSLVAQVQEAVKPEEIKEQIKEEIPVKKTRAKKEYGEPYMSENRQLIRSNFTGKILDITDWPQSDKNTFVRINPEDPSYHINTKSGIYGKGRITAESGVRKMIKAENEKKKLLNATASKKTPNKKSLNRVKANIKSVNKPEEVPVIITEQSAL